MLERDLTLKETRNDIEWQPKYIEIIACLFVGALMLTTVLAPKLFDLGPFQFSTAILIFPLTGIFGDMLTEIYGFNRTRRIIWMGFVCNLVLVFFTSLAIHIPPSPNYLDQEAFATVLGSVPRIAISSFIAYLFSEFFNSLIMSKMKIWSNAKNFPLRAILSTLIAQVVDSVLFFTFAFGGLLPLGVIINLIVSSWLLKSIYEIVVLPITMVGVKKLKNLEGVEHFDHQPTPIFKF